MFNVATSPQLLPDHTQSDRDEHVLDDVILEHACTKTKNDNVTNGLPGYVYG